MQRTTIAAVLILLFGFAGEADAKHGRCPTAPLVRAAETGCVQRAPLARFAERAVIAAPGETIQLEFVLRNADGCTCPPVCYRLQPGYHFPHDSTPAMKAGVPSLERFAGGHFEGIVCLAPGEEVAAWYELPVAPDQHEPVGYLIASVFVLRDDTDDFRISDYDAEGAVVCQGYDYLACRAKAYTPAGVPD